MNIIKKKSPKNKLVKNKKINKKNIKSNKKIVYKKIKSISKKSNIKLLKYGVSKVGDKKFYVTFNKNNKIYNVNFGNKNYQDYTAHKDINRRSRYLARAKGITDKYGNKTYKKITSPNFWSVNVLW